jgi:hypothetical protein
VSEEQETELEVRTYSISSPDMLEAMLEYTEILEKTARGEMSKREAKALYVEKILPVVKELQEKYAPKEVKPKKAKKKKTTKKKKKKAKG